jgi:hypothetical protein
MIVCVWKCERVRVWVCERVRVSVRVCERVRVSVRVCECESVWVWECMSVWVWKCERVRVWDCEKYISLTYDKLQWTSVPNNNNHPHTPNNAYAFYKLTNHTYTWNLLNALGINHHPDGGTDTKGYKINKSNLYTGLKINNGCCECKDVDAIGIVIPPPPRSATRPPIRRNIPQAALHSLMLLKMGKIAARNMWS